MGYGALMGILRNYEVINPFINSSIDAFNRLKPGFEAPVCIVTSLGHSVEEPSRNRSILVGLVRDMANPLATRFEVRSPSPLSNTYLVIASLYQVMLDGIQAAVASRKTNKELEREISKGYGEESFYLDQYREYRSEENVFEYFTEEERNKRFGIPPATPWENVKNLKKYAHRVEILHRGDVITQDIVDSVVASTIDRWTNELASRVIYDDMDIIRECRKLHTPETSTDLDDLRWEEIQRLKWELVKSSTTKTSLLESIRIALQNKDYDQASNLQLTLNQKMQELREKYIQYKRNLFEA
jgi:glutamine synthetase